LRVREGLRPMSGSIVDRVIAFLLEAREGYRIGRERFGFYWTVFTVSMLLFSVIMILFSIIAVVLYT
jgi:hypothetical protein